MTKGWYLDAARHVLAAKGIKTTNRQLQKAAIAGGKFEKEHAETIRLIKAYPKTSVPEAELLIALDHIKEDPNYYKKLAKMEGRK
jgi:hypothetical protein